jgi:phosphatidylserine/phosphatidylglycerophosphate/cardiolipin synthase-like enzyme
MMRRCAALLLMLTLFLAGCGTSTAPDSGVSTGGATSGATAQPTSTCPSGGCASEASGVVGVSVFVEPAAGESPVTQLIRGAQKSVWVEVYLLTDRTVIYALEDAAQRGVDVRVLLEPNPYGSGATTPAQTLSELQAAGVHAQASNPAFHYTHEKTIVIDNATLLVLTANLTKSGLGGSSYAQNREYGVVDTSPEDVHEAADIFQADWQRVTPTLSDPHLVVSPVNARARLTAFIAAAHTSLIIQDEEMYDSQIEAALVAAAQRGVNVQVELPQPTGSASGGDVARLTQGGVHVRYVSTIYIHAKMMVADGALGFVGSENFSANSLDDNRELGLLIADPGAIATLTATFQHDWSTAQPA